MTKEVVCLQSIDNLARAVELLKPGKFRHIPILDEQGRMAGIISDRDVLRHPPFAGRRPPKPQKSFREYLFAINTKDKILQMPLEQIMTRKVLHILPSCTIENAADILYKKRVSCLPVIDGHGDLKGIVTVTDLMRALLAAYEPAEKAGLITSQSSTC
jgi:acetoin utilization protein AcuB